MRWDLFLADAYELRYFWAAGGIAGLMWTEHFASSYFLSRGIPFLDRTVLPVTKMGTFAMTQFYGRVSESRTDGFGVGTTVGHVGLANMSLDTSERKAWELRAWIADEAFRTDSGQPFAPDDMYHVATESSAIPKEHILREKIIPLQKAADYGLRHHSDLASPDVLVIESKRLQLTGAIEYEGGHRCIAYYGPGNYVKSFLRTHRRPLFRTVTAIACISTALGLLLMKDKKLGRY